MPLKSTIRSVAAAALRFASRSWWPILGRLPRLRRRKRVLLFANSELMAEYLNCLADLLRGDERLEIRLTAPPYHSHLGATPGELAQRLGVRPASYILSLFQWWDLIVFADHPYTRVYHPDCPRVLIYHSLTSGFVSGGKSYRYGPLAMRPDGRPQYTAMFEPSEAARRRALGINPRLGDSLVVAGDLRADIMLESDSRRDDIRSEMGFAPDDVVVLIQSTWGPQSLMETVGMALINQATALAEAGKYRFILSTHPNHWNGEYAGEHDIASRLLEADCDAVVVRRPGTPWEPYLVAADMAVTDYTGLCVAFALLKRPMLFTPMAEGTVDPQSVEWRLYESLPRINDPKGFETALDQARKNYPTDELESAANRILSCPGEAASRMTAVLYEVLNLPPAAVAESSEESQP